QSSQLEVFAKQRNDGQTGTCLSLITPDAQRTMRACLGLSQTLEGNDVDSSVLPKKCDWVFLEGYLFLNPPSAREAMTKSIEYAKASGAKVALTLSAGFVVVNHREAIVQMLADVDLLFANEEEALALTEADSIEKA